MDTTHTGSERRRRTTSKPATPLSHGYGYHYTLCIVEERALTGVVTFVFVLKEYHRFALTSYEEMSKRHDSDINLEHTIIFVFVTFNRRQ